jgi:hypothetical protein
MAFQFLCALLAGWILEAWFKPDSFGRHIARIARAIRQELSQ